MNILIFAIILVTFFVLVSLILVNSNNMNNNIELGVLQPIEQRN